MSGKTLAEARLETMRLRLRGTIEGNGGFKTIAALTGIHVNTLSNYVRGVVKEPPVSVLIQIAEAAGVQPAWLMALDASDAPREQFFAEGDATAYDGAPAELPSKPVMGHGYWRVTSRALELAGILPGDIIEFDLGATPRMGEVVVAQLYSDDAATTVLRLFNPPYLTVRTLDPAIDARPVQIDPDGARVNIMGAFVRLVRQGR